MKPNSIHIIDRFAFNEAAIAWVAFCDYLSVIAGELLFTRRNRNDKQDKQYLFHNHILSKNN